MASEYSNLSAEQLQISTCTTCGKRSYLSRRMAKRAARTIHQGARMRAYECNGFWHLTSAARWPQGGARG